MEPGSSIEKLGFKRWYERQLIESHAWLVSCILCALAIAATLELTGFRLTSFAGLLAFGFVYAAGLVCWHSLKRYRASMRQSRGRTTEDMVQCAVCGLHLPKSDSLTQNGLHYCSAAHLEQRHER